MPSTDGDVAPGLPYQPYYCEENVWKLFDGEYVEGEAQFAVVISNAAGAVPLWNQHAAPSDGRPVLWDYHVVAVGEGGSGCSVWDLDSQLATPVSFRRWFDETFPEISRLRSIHRPAFRVVESGDYLETLSSDRSHMRTDGGSWREPPPDWSPIYRSEEGMNLGRFVDLDDDWVGEVLGPAEFEAKFSDQTSGAST